MVIRFDAHPRQRLLPLFDRLQPAPRHAPRRLTGREIAHRQRMLEHLRAGARPQATPGALSARRTETRTR